MRTWLGRREADLAVAVGVAVTGVQVYNLALGPWLIFQLNAYWPSFDYQIIPAKEIPVQFWAAWDMLARNVAVGLGGYWPLTVCGVVALAGEGWWGRRRGVSGGAPMRSWRGWLRSSAGVTVITVGLVVLGQAAMSLLMIARHPFVYYWQDHLHWYYPLPWVAVVWFAVLLTADGLCRRGGGVGRTAAQVVLGLWLAGNLASLPHYRARMIAGPWFGPVHAQSQRYKGAVRSALVDPMLAANYLELQQRVQPAVGRP